MQKTPVGIIGGSGLYEIEALANRQEQRLETPYGTPSDTLVTGTLAEVPVVFLARHGRHHQLLPSEIPFQANIYALKQLNVKHLISFSAVGSLQDEIAPLDFILPTQFIDLTRQRKNTFFGQGVVAHVSMADPVCSHLHACLVDAADQVAQKRAFNLHTEGTYLCIEGPQFSTRAESNWFRNLGASIVGMTNMPEARLAREAQMAYTTLGMVTDYDCWHPERQKVTADYAISNLLKNSLHAQEILLAAVERFSDGFPESEAHRALQAGLVTPLDGMNASWREHLEVLLS